MWRSKTSRRRRQEAALLGVCMKVKQVGRQQLCYRMNDATNTRSNPRFLTSSSAQKTPSSQQLFRPPPVCLVCKRPSQAGWRGERWEGSRLRFGWLLPECDTLHPGVEGWGAAGALDWSDQVCAVGRAGRSSPEVRPLLLSSALICANLQRSVWAAARRRGVSYTCSRAERSSCRRGLDVGVIALGDMAGLHAGDAEARMLLLCAWKRRAFDQ